MSQNLSSAAVVIGALKFKIDWIARSPDVASLVKLKY